MSKQKWRLVARIQTKSVVYEIQKWGILAILKILLETTSATFSLL